MHHSDLLWGAYLTDFLAAEFIPRPRFPWAASSQWLSKRAAGYRIPVRHAHWTPLTGDFGSKAPHGPG